MNEPNESSATHACPACGKPVDALRAGRVAFVGERFLYFCSSECKARFFAEPRAASPIVSDEVVTAAPPQVVAAPPPPREAEAPPVPSAEIAAPPPVAAAPPSLRESEPTEDPPRSMPLRPWSSEASQTTEPEVPPPPPPRRQRAARIHEVVLAAGVGSGLLSLGAALLGSGAVVRLTLATLAVLAATTQVVLVGRGQAFARPAWIDAAVRLVPLFGTLLLSARARYLGEPSGTYLVAAGVGAAAMLLVERTLGRAREQLDVRRTRVGSALHGTAVLADGSHLAADAVRAGDVFVVEEGAAVPADGVVASGEAVVSPFPGAPVDVPKRYNDVVVAGARVLSGTLRVTASFGGAERAYERSLSGPGRPDRGASLVRIGRRGAREGALVVFGLVALATFGTGSTVAAALGNGLSAVLAMAGGAVAAAVAVEHARAHLRALDHGILYRDADAFDRAGTVSRAVVCARGTLLLGEPELLSIETLAGASEDEVSAIAAAVANGWSHPFGVALLRHARDARPPVLRSVHHQGSGAVAVDSSGARIVLGRRPFLLSEGISVAVADASVTAHEEQGRSVLLVARGDRVVGLFAMQDGLRSGARAAIQRLHDAEIEPVLLSGESRETCEMLGRSLDIDNLRPDVARGERAQAVRSLGEGGDVVAAIGTPALDEEALGAADVAVALGSAGAPGADPPIALAGSDVRDAVLSLVVPRIARDRSRTTMALGLAPGLAFAFATSFGLLSPAFAPLAYVLGAALAILYAKE